MSIRIHQLSKKIGMDNKDLLALLQQRGYHVTSASSTVDNISAESLVQEFGNRGETAGAEESAGDHDTAGTATAERGQDAPEVAPAAPAAALPSGVFVKTAEQVDRERREREAAKAASRAPIGMITPPAPIPPARPAPMHARPPVTTHYSPRGGPAPLAPPSHAPRPSAPASLAPPAPRPASPPVVTPPPASPPTVSSASVAPPPRTPVHPAPAAHPGPVVAPPPTAPVAGPVRHQPAPAPSVVRAPASHAAHAAPPPVVRTAPAAPPPPPVRTGPVSMAPPSPRPVSAPAMAVPAAGAPQAAGAGPGGETKVLQIKPPIVVREFAALLGLKQFKLTAELMQLGIFAGGNQSIDEAVASRIAIKYGFLLDIKHRGEAPIAKEKEKPVEPKVDESKFLEPRPAVVCIMGHVDHGKTSLLDKIRSTNVVAGEAGGITQHIGAYQVEVNNRRITFIDTPGHAAFNKMRERGANVTDIAILVVAADDGFMPQTDEALRFIRAAEVTPIVAINKIDTKGANVDRVKAQMQDRDLMPEDWGGETITVPVSALKGEGIDTLLEMILLQSDVLELKANPKAPATGVVIEAEIEIGRGPTATVLVENGTLRAGDAVVCGPYFAKIRAMFDDQGRPVKEAPPASAVRVIGWSGTPECGGIVRAVKNQREAERIAEETEFELRRQAGAAPAPKPASIDTLFEQIAAQSKKVQRVVVKGDVFGSVEALVAALGTIKSDKVSLEIVSSDVGQVSKNDVLMASAAKAGIVGFNVGLENGVEALAKHHGVTISHYDIIYELIDAVRDLMADLLEPETRELKLGVAEVRAVFPVSKGFVAGCLVTEGRVQLLASARLRRAGKVEMETRIVTLRRVKEEVKEVRAGTECGIHLEDYEAYQPGDLIECFELQKLRPSL